MTLIRLFYFKVVGKFSREKVSNKNNTIKTAISLALFFRNKEL
jgi:hypothetical protein